MSWLFGTPQPGDWIVTKRRLKVTFTDHLLGDDGGIRPGAHGVITDQVGWNTLVARLDTGLFGSVTVRVRPADVRVTRRGGGVDEYGRRVARINAVRAGVAAALVAPLAYFSVRHFLAGGSTDGLLATLVDSAIYGALDLLTYALTEPLSAATYVAIVWAAGRFAFR